MSDIIVLALKGMLCSFLIFISSVRVTCLETTRLKSKSMSIYARLAIFFFYFSILLIMAKMSSMS